MYFYAGVAKINGDWLRGEPIRDWLAGSTDFPVIGPLFTEEPVVWLFAYGGLLLDLLVTPFLLWRRTRWAAFALIVTFHLMNARLFSIGIFPWLMIGATALFFAPGWPRLLLGRFMGRVSWPRQQAAGVPVLGVMEKLTLGLLSAYLLVQVLLPLRHWLYPGSVHWAEEGHHFAWHMKLRDKEGDTWFIATDPVRGVSWLIDPQEYLTRRQAAPMTGRPDMVLQLAHHIAGDLRGRGYSRIQVRAQVMVSLNGRDRQLLIDPAADLAAQRRIPLLPAAWIMPLEEPLRGASARRPVQGDEAEQ